MITDDTQPNNETTCAKYDPGSIFCTTDRKKFAVVVSADHSRIKYVEVEDLRRAQFIRCAIAAERVSIRDLIVLEVEYLGERPEYDLELGSVPDDRYGDTFISSDENTQYLYLQEQSIRIY